jgi:hypothetical protein
MLNTNLKITENFLPDTLPFIRQSLLSSSLPSLHAFIQFLYIIGPNLLLFWFVCSFVPSNYHYSMTYLFIQPLDVLVDRDSSVGIATRYRLEGPVFESP